ncbi:hypothetical protein ACIRBY_37080 [Streptomyces sp. NPDC096136]|uniref:hypothetical protein n=1 Tax=Streptomyces sp. NPDC096136 TaxID=3366076 RepID=UPI00381A12B4
MACTIAGIISPAAGAMCVAADWTAKKAGESAFDSIAKSFADGAGWMLKEMTAGWLQLPSPQMDQTGQSGPIWFLRESTEWVTAWVAVLALLIASGRMIWERRSEPAKTAAAGILRLVLVSGASIAGFNLLMAGGDSFSVWIVNRSTGCSEADQAAQHCVDMFGQRVLAFTAFNATNTAGSGVIIILALLILIASIIQIAFILARNAMLIILVGTLPLTAAASTTEAGKEGFRKAFAWSLGLWLYKPAAAIVYAAAFSAIGQSKTSDIFTQISGAVLLFLAAFTLPAMMKFTTSLVQVTAGGNSRGAGSVIGGAGSAVASGAIALKTGGASKAAGAAGKGAQATGAGQGFGRGVPGPVGGQNRPPAPSGDAKPLGSDPQKSRTTTPSTGSGAPNSAPGTPPRPRRPEEEDPSGSK